MPEGLSLARHPGGVIDDDGIVLEGVELPGGTVVTGDDVTLRNVRVRGELVLRGSGVRLETSEVGALAVAGAEEVRIRDVEVVGASGKDGIHITSDTGRAADVTIEDVWVHDPVVTPTSHYDGIQVRGVDGLRIERVVVDLGAYVPQHNAALFLEDANGGNDDVVVLDSWLVGGGYTVYSFASAVVIERSVIVPGVFGILYPTSWIDRIDRFEGNVDGEGRALSLGRRGIS